ncbi:integrase catalytic domain-containing protein [Trichonephila clavata]|uniref:Integrase catalytic domain-containing protein n=1 Tax=Trichonephila clavata TaxID=2740835 RepID=A0A8X6IEJ5_TRICU|nr:integrase catalytic domain-containing protein [Trichonephila clavata]
MNAIQQKRTTIRGAFTKSANNLETLLSSELSVVKFDEIEVTLEQLSVKFKQLKEWDDQVLDLLQQEKCSQDIYEKEYLSYEKIKLARNTFTSEKLSKRNSDRYEGKNSIPTATELLSSHKHTYSKDQSKKFKKNETCVFCEKSHPSQNCKDSSTTKMSLEDKKNIVKNKKACFVCLGGGHRAVSCKSNVRCFACRNRHFPILCSDLASNLDHNFPNKANNTKVEETVTNTFNSHVRHSDVYLQT